MDPPYVYPFNIMRTFETGCDCETCFDLQQNAAVRILKHFESAALTATGAVHATANVAAEIA